jgi:hypothetical protein
MTRSKVIRSCLPPVDSGIASVLGRTFPSSPENALLFSTASLAKYSSPPTLSSAAHICSRSAMDVLFFDPFGLPGPGFPWPILNSLFGCLFNPVFFCVFANVFPCLSKRPSGSLFTSGFLSSVSNCVGSPPVGDLCLLISPTAVAWLIGFHWGQCDPGTSPVAGRPSQRRSSRTFSSARTLR